MGVDVAAVGFTDLDGWTDLSDGVCPWSVTVTVGGVDVQLTCEVEGEHDEHEATLRWKADPPQDEDG